MAMVGHKRAFCVIIYWGMVSFSRQFSARRKRPLALSQLKYSLRESETDEPFEYTWRDEFGSGIGTSLTRSPSLVLNADYTPLSHYPLSLWSWQDSLRSVLAGKCVIVSLYDDLVIRSVSTQMKLPSVIAMKRFHKKTDHLSLTRDKVFLRDNYRCQYCGDRYNYQDLSLDHVIPRCRGGKSHWKNLTTACKTCNTKKGNAAPDELSALGMRLRSVPLEPSQVEIQMKARRLKKLHNCHPHWQIYLTP